MTDYYSILGLPNSASAEEIKKAYRSMAMKHHPDRGGDESNFKQISEAYEVLSDPEKKQMIDMGVDPNAQSHGHGGFQQGPFDFQFDSGNFNDIFSQFGFGFSGRQRQQKRNRSINIAVELDLEDVLTGKDIAAEIAIPGASKKNININIPPGIDSGQQIRYQGLGDNSIPGVPPGDLIVNIRILPNRKFKREGQHIILEKTINVWDAILGTTLTIETLDKKHIDINVPAGTQPNTVMNCKGEGLPGMRNSSRGNLLIKLSIEIPKNLSSDSIKTLRKIRDGI
jgi:DnaJ-class molecular chaperone